jgi:hypothetical protein
MPPGETRTDALPDRTQIEGIPMKSLPPAISRPLFAALAAASMLVPGAVLADTTATVGGVTYTNKGLVGVGRIPANQRDKFGETFGSGSGMAIDQAG